MAALLKELDGDASSDEKVALHQRLIALGPEPGYDLLREALDGARPSGVWIAECVGDWRKRAAPLRPALLGALLRGDENAPVFAFALASSRGVRELAEALRRGPAVARDWAADSISRLDPPAPASLAPTLIEALDVAAAGAERRMNLVHALAELPAATASRVVPAVLGKLGDESEDVRYAALGASAAWIERAPDQAPRITDALLEHGSQESEGHLQAEYANVLSTTQHARERVRALLNSWLGSEDEDVREAAREALDALGKDG